MTIVVVAVFAIAMTLVCCKKTLLIMYGSMSEVYETSKKVRFARMKGLR